MSSLTQISVSARKLLVFAIILFVLYFILNAIVNAIVASLRKPPPPILLQAANEYGVLPAPKFVTNQNSAGLNLILENVEGRPPESTTAAKVYKLPEKLYTSLSLDRAKGFARGLGFSSEPVAETKTNYLFIDKDDPLRTLQINVISSNFLIKYAYNQKPDVLKSLINTDKNQLSNEAKNYLRPLFDSTFFSGTITTEYLKVDPSGTQLIGASDRFDPIHGVTLNFFRPNLDGMKIVTPAFFTSPVNVTHIPSPDSRSQYPYISYIYWPIASDNYSLYAVRTSDQAWQDLKDGYGAVISMGNNTSEKIVIRDIYMAYYDTEIQQPFLQPIYVFEGDNNFVAYVPAVSPELLETN